MKIGKTNGRNPWISKFVRRLISPLCSVNEQAWARADKRNDFYENENILLRLFELCSSACCLRCHKLTPRKESSITMTTKMLKVGRIHKTRTTKWVVEQNWSQRRITAHFVCRRKNQTNSDGNKIILKCEQWQETLCHLSFRVVFSASWHATDNTFHDNGFIVTQSSSPAIISRRNEEHCQCVAEIHEELSTSIFSSLIFIGAFFRSANETMNILNTFTSSKWTTMSASLTTAQSTSTKSWNKTSRSEWSICHVSWHQILPLQWRIVADVVVLLALFPSSVVACLTLLFSHFILWLNRWQHRHVHQLTNHKTKIFIRKWADGKKNNTNFSSTKWSNIYQNVFVSMITIKTASATLSFDRNPAFFAFRFAFTIVGLVFPLFAFVSIFLHSFRLSREKIPSDMRQMCVKYNIAMNCCFARRKKNEKIYIQFIGDKKCDCCLYKHANEFGRLLKLLFSSLVAVLVAWEKSQTEDANIWQYYTISESHHNIIISVILFHSPSLIRIVVVDISLFIFICCSPWLPFCRRHWTWRWMSFR